MNEKEIKMVLFQILRKWDSYPEAKAIFAGKDAILESIIMLTLNKIDTKSLGDSVLTFKKMVGEERYSKLFED